MSGERATHQVLRHPHWRLTPLLSSRTLPHAGAQGVFAKIQDIIAAAAQTGSSKVQRHSIGDLLNLCLVALAFICELSLSKDPASLGQIVAQLADSLTDAILQVHRSCVPSLRDFQCYDSIPCAQQHIYWAAPGFVSERHMFPALSICILELRSIAAAFLPLDGGGSDTDQRAQCAGRCQPSRSAMAARCGAVFC